MKRDWSTRTDLQPLVMQTEKILLVAFADFPLQTPNVHTAKIYSSLPVNILDFFL